MTKERFLSLLPNIRRVAREYGYAIGIHGSMERDFDLIAVPWAKGACNPDELAEVIFITVRAKRWRGWHPIASLASTPKPHGRKCYTFDWDETNENRGYIDLSITPRSEMEVLENLEEQIVNLQETPL